MMQPPSWRARLARVGTGLLAVASAAGADLDTETSALFSASGHCVFCHDQWGGALVDRSGVGVSITGDWRGTMMAHSFRDPLWQAVMEAEVAARPARRGFIEDKCQTCHAPMARTQHVYDGGRELGYAEAQGAGLAADGVSCTLCHQIQADTLGNPESYTGGYRVHDTRQIFGPYNQVVTMPMRRHVGYTPQWGRHVQDSALCATCHTLYTPVFGPDGTVVGRFPEQVPYLEWLAGDRSREGTHCQDCHMERLDEPIRISARPPWLDGRQPFWRHQFVGGNGFMLDLMAAHADEIRPNEAPEGLARTARRARQQLRDAARLEVAARRRGADLMVEVAVENLTGHKFPTGHPYRRAWLQLAVYDAHGALVFASGLPARDGSIAGVGQGFAPHYQQITRAEEVQVYEAVLGNAAGERTYRLLDATQYLKDNRIPPKGFAPPSESGADVAVKGRAEVDADYRTGTAGTDRVSYRVPLAASAGPWEVRVALCYQAVPPEAVEDLRSSDGVAARRFDEFYRRADRTPETVQERSLTVN